MRKIILFCLIVFFFLSGLTLGGNFSNGASNFFEEAKDDFENEITKPNNNYENIELVPNELIINKAAHKLESFITEKIEDIFSKIS